jgi:uncharacterized protein
VRFIGLIIFLALPALLLSAEAGPPARQGAVNDLADVISPETRGELEALSIALFRETGFSLVVLTVPSLPENTTIEEYAVKAYEKWGIGVKGKDAGALVLAAIQDRQMRIEVGYGAEGYLPDAICKRIIEQVMKPAFRQGDFNAGFAGAAAEIAGRTAKEFNVDPSRLALRPQPGRNEEQIQLSPFQILLILILVLLVIGTRPGRALLTMLLISNILGGGRRGFGGGGGFGGGFSSGGGFGGFGGGMSGGGGSSGRW